jgi:hypothetical protein
MKEGTDESYFERRDSQLLLELTPERVLDALPRLAWPPGRATAPGSTVASLRTRAATHSRGC